MSLVNKYNDLKAVFGEEMDQEIRDELWDREFGYRAPKRTYADALYSAAEALPWIAFFACVAVVLVALIFRH